MHIYNRILVLKKEAGTPVSQVPLERMERGTNGATLEAKLYGKHLVYGHSEADMDN